MDENPVGQVVRHIRRMAGAPEAAFSEDRQLLVRLKFRRSNGGPLPGYGLGDSTPRTADGLFGAGRLSPGPGDDLPRTMDTTCVSESETRS
jgi:hypothetical protein